MAVILSLGMLLEKVDTQGFIVGLLKKAKEENPSFEFTPALQASAFGLSEHFNQGKLTPEVFKSTLLAMLGISSLEDSEFWLAWNKMITLGDVADKIQLLQTVGHEHKVLVYLSSDTNVVHLEAISNGLRAQGIDVDIQKDIPLLAQFPLYATCHTGKSRQELTSLIVDDIRSKALNKPGQITLIFGNPDNVKDKNHQALVRNELERTKKWCEENQVAITLHNDSLEETLTPILTIDDNVIEPPRLSSRN